MRKIIGTIYILVALIMFFSVPIVEGICEAISIANAVGAGNFVIFRGVLLWIPVITLAIGIFLIFKKERLSSAD